MSGKRELRRQAAQSAESWAGQAARPPLPALAAAPTSWNSLRQEDGAPRELLCGRLCVPHAFPGVQGRLSSTFPREGSVCQGQCLSLHTWSPVIPRLPPEWKLVPPASQTSKQAPKWSPSPTATRIGCISLRQNYLPYILVITKMMHTCKNLGKDKKCSSEAKKSL